jgi:mutual gliding-motility protein MglA
MSTTRPFKVVWFGPALAGKQTTVRHLHRNIQPECRGELVEDPAGPTCWFEYRPGAGSACIQIHAVISYADVHDDEAACRQGLAGADGVVFIADSQTARHQANILQLERLTTLGGVPLVFQYNKRDCSDIASIDEIDAALNPAGRPCFGTVAVTGSGVFEVLQAVCERVLAAARTSCDTGR